MMFSAGRLHGDNVATQAYPGWPLSCGRVAVLDCVHAGSGGPCSERRLGGRGGQISPCRTGALHRRLFSPVTGTPAGERLARPCGQLWRLFKGGVERKKGRIWMRTLNA
jgi:hypothetical protein